MSGEVLDLLWLEKWCEEHLLEAKEGHWNNTVYVEDLINAARREAKE